MPPAAPPVATCRLQFGASFTFENATAIGDYLDALGVSHCYASSPDLFQCVFERFPVAFLEATSQ